MTELEFRNAIINDINKSCFVEAGAGAGKTTLIIDRVINQLNSGIKPSEIVIITYTNAAAEELRDRISNKIKDSKPDILKEFSKMKITTIHSFCLSILEEYCFEAKIPLGFSLLVDKQEEDLLKELFDSWSKDEENKLDHKIINKYIDVKKVKDYIYSLYKSLVEVGDDTKLGDIPTLDIDKYISEIESLLKDFYIKYNDNVLSIVRKTGVDKYSNTNLSNIIEFIDELDLILKNKDYKDNPKLLFKFIDDSLKIFKVDKLIKKTSKELYEACEKYLEDLLSNIKDYLKKVISIIKYRTLLDYAYDAYKYYINNRPSDIVTNNSILFITNKLVSENEDVRLKLVDKYKCIYVDEYQDTNYIQDEIVYKLSIDENKELLPGHLFLVGDPKQSIYKFTGADVEVFLNRGEYFKSLYESQPDKYLYIKLNYNFRSNISILDYVNSNFAFKFKSINYEPMIVAKGHESIPDDNDLLTGFYQYETEGEYELNNDINSLIRLIKHLVKYKKIIEYKKDDKAYAISSIRPIQYKDIMIVTDDTTDFDKYLRAFKDNDIPISLNGKFEPNTSFIINSFTKLYRCLIDLNNKLNLYSAIEILKLTKISKPKDVKSNADINNYYINIINNINNKIKDYDGYSKAKYLIDHIELLVDANTDLTEIEIKSITKKLNQILETVISSKSCSSYELADYFDEYKDSKVKFEINLSKNNNSVRFMNFHRCKGLESEIVIFAKRDSLRNFTFESYRESNLIYPSLSSGPKNILYSSYYFNNDIESKSKESSLEEEKRFEYVILTRAKQAFIYMPIIEKTTCCLFNLDNTNSYIKNCKVIKENDLEEVVIEGIKNKKPVKFKKKENINIDDLKTPNIIIKNPSLEEDLINADLLYKSFKKIDKDKYMDGRPTDNIVGSILHRCFELLVKSNLDKNSINKIVDIAIKENTDEDRIINNKDFFISCLNAFINSDISKLLYKDNNKNHPEYMFSYFVKNEYHNGSIDLLIENDDGTYLILDYKSDAKEELTDSDLEKYLDTKYRPQVSLYVDAISTCLNVDKNKIKTKIVYFRKYQKDKNFIDIKLYSLD